MTNMDGPIGLEVYMRLERDKLQADPGMNGLFWGINKSAVVERGKLHIHYDKIFLKKEEKRK